MYCIFIKPDIGETTSFEYFKQSRVHPVPYACTMTT